MHKLSHVEALRAQLLLENALKKLQFLSYLGNNSAPGDNRDELSVFMGDEISRIIQEQRSLEKKYEGLIKERGSLKGLMHKSGYGKVQQEIQEVAHRLRESNKALCRNLKENPNAQGNLIKMQQERIRVQTVLEDTKGELLELGFSQLVSRVDAERRDQELLQEMKKKEREASNTVKLLETELQGEYYDHEREMKSAMSEIKTLKEELQRNKTESSILLATEEKKLKAQESALQRALQQKELALTQEVHSLQKAKLREQTAHERCHDFLFKKTQDLAEERTNWATKYDKDHQDAQDKLQKIREDSGAVRQRLMELQERQAVEGDKKKKREKEAEMVLQIEKFRLKQEQKMNEAVYYLQEEGRNYIQRMLIRAAKNKGKKGKKGKKK